MKRNAWLGLTAAIVVVGGTSAVIFRGGKEEVKFRTAAVDKGNITQRISATGTINALIQVPVGTQVSGVVTALYADFNSLVKKGQVIAQIDQTPWLTNLKDAEASLQRVQASLNNAKADYKRNKQLWENKLISDADLDAKDLALKTATAQLESARATVTKAKTELGYCTLKAPVDGVVVSRVVDVGQTVAASFSTPNVFTIAQDLSKMKVQAAIDEADIGQVRVGQRAFFTVDSYPDKQFQGVVSEVQLMPVINQNVVTYNVVMEVTNEARTTYSPDAAKGAPEGKPGQAAGARTEPAGGARPDHARGERPEGGWQGHRPEGAGGMRPRGGDPSQRGGEAKGAGKAAPSQGMGVPQAATIETNTARYIPQGSPVYKGTLALFPGMTANCTIVTNRRQDTLRVPAVALRFNPAAFLKDAADKKPAGAAQGPQQGGQRQGGGANTSRGMVAKREDRVWILANGKPKAVTVKAGVSDGQFTEISGDNVTEGMVVLTGIDDPSKKVQAAGASPLGGGPGGPRR
jgi:HlyD family secretion protein